MISYLHSGVTLQTVQGPVKFNALGENLSRRRSSSSGRTANFVQVLPAADPGSVKILYPKPSWGG